MTAKLGSITARPTHWAYGLLTTVQAMPSLFPTTGVLGDVFSPQLAYTKHLSNPKPKQDLLHPPKHTRFPAWSAVDDMKTKAGALSNEAQKEISKASSAAQAKAGEIELYSLKYYAACTFGGLVACVSVQAEHRDCTLAKS